jgi:hypothetical protein
MMMDIQIFSQNGSQDSLSCWHFPANEWEEVHPRGLVCKRQPWGRTACSSHFTAQVFLQPGKLRNVVSSWEDHAEWRLKRKAETRLWKTTVFAKGYIFSLCLWSRCNHMDWVLHMRQVYWELCVGGWIVADSKSSSCLAYAVSWKTLLCLHAFGSCHTLSLVLSEWLTKVQKLPGQSS